MRKNWLHWGLALLMLLTPFLSLRSAESVKAASAVEIKIHYNRPDGKYEGWNLWVWEKGKDGKSYSFTGDDDFGKVAIIQMETDATEFGFIVRLNDWQEKDVGDDRFFTVSGGKAEIWLKSADPEVYIEKPSVGPVTPPPPIEGDLTLKVHYHRFDKNFESWNLWVWARGQDGNAFNFTSEDSYGKIATFKVDLKGASDVGFIIRKGEWLAKDVDADRFIPVSRAKNGVLEVWLLQGDSRIYYNPNDVDLSPKFLSAKLDAVDQITVTTSVPIPLIYDKKEGLVIKTGSTEVGIRNIVFREDGGKPVASSSFTILLSEPLDLSKPYTLSREGYGSVNIIFNGVFSTKAFEEAFTYEGELGAIYTKEKTTFKLWAPSATNVSLSLYAAGSGGSPIKTVPMIKSDKGVWVLEQSGDLHGVYFTYLVDVLGMVNEAVDPYARAVGVNGLRGMVVDLSRTNPEGWENDKRPDFKVLSDAIIYELHIRDISVHPESGIENKGKFLGLTEKGTRGPQGVKTGLDHLIDLGITHLHLLPAFDFRSIDETTLENNSFNWGYDPQHFNVPEGSYSTDPTKGEVRINEFKQMVMTLHKAGIRVVMDVVYNHTGASADSDFSKIVPNYYYRFNDAGGFSNGSGTGNETASERSMVRKHFVDSVVYWATEYNIDGFRFDLMALHDIETMNAIRAALDEVDPSILIYGEGWTGGESPLPDEQKALKRNTSRLDRIAAFSDDIRDGLKGHVFTDTDKGFVNGQPGMEESVKFGIVASIMFNAIDYSKVKYSKTPWAKEPYHTITYVEAHDNLTLWDKLMVSNPEASEKELIAMHRLANAIVLTSQGIPFIHAGSEFLRTKGGDHNSYRSPDSVNQLDYNRMAQYLDNVEYFKGLIQLRKAHPAFRMPEAELIRTHLKFLDMPVANMVGYTLSGNANGDKWETIAVLMNANDEDIEVELAQSGWAVVVNGEKAGTEVIEKISGSKVIVPARTLVVLVDAGSLSSNLWIYLLLFALGAGAGGFVYWKKTKKNVKEAA
jgi:pullulanase